MSNILLLPTCPQPSPPSDLLSLLDLLPPVPYIYYPYFLLFYLAYITLVLLPAALLVPTGVLGLVTMSALRDVLDSHQIQSPEDITTLLTRYVTDNTRSAVRDRILPSLRTAAVSLRPPMLDMSFHEFMMSGAFMRR